MLKAELDQKNGRELSNFGQCNLLPTAQQSFELAIKVAEELDEAGHIEAILLADT